jgi:acyl-CoA reductase-like NAD-dependent aldehyde dehydrogenase
MAEYGLASSVHSGDLEHALSIARGFRGGGMVHINDQILNYEHYILFGE